MCVCGDRQYSLFCARVLRGVMKARRDVVLGHTFSERESMIDNLALHVMFLPFCLFFLVRASSCALSPSHVVIPVAGAWISGVARLSFFVCVRPVTSMSLVF